MDRYTVAGVALSQLSYRDAQKHKASIVEVASLAAREGDPATVPVLYDNLLRFVPTDACCAPPLCARVAPSCGFPYRASYRRLEWEDLSGKDKSFRIKDVAGVLNEHLLRTAKADAKALGATSAAAGVSAAVLGRAPLSPRVVTSSQQKLTKCSYCSNFGHTAAECRKKAAAEAATAAAAAANGKKRVADTPPGVPPADKLAKVSLFYACSSLRVCVVLSRQMKCHKCKEFGHLAKDCPGKKQVPGS